MTTLGYLDRSVRVLDSDGQIPARSVRCSFPDMWVINTPSQVTNELACWFFTVQATDRCQRHKMGGRFDGVVSGGVCWHRRLD